MKKGRIVLALFGLCTGVGLSSGVAETASGRDPQGPDRILRMLDEKEQRYIQGKAKPQELSQEEIEHTRRIQRLHELETAKEVETEPAGAEIAAVGPAPRQQEAEIQDLELQQQESNSVMMRDMARLRAEVMRLNARVQALEMELEGAGDSSEFEAEPRHYFPIR